MVKSIEAIVYPIALVVTDIVVTKCCHSNKIHTDNYHSYSQQKTYKGGTTLGPFLTQFSAYDFGATYILHT